MWAGSLFISGFVSYHSSPRPFTGLDSAKHAPKARPIDLLSFIFKWSSTVFYNFSYHLFKSLLNITTSRGLKEHFPSLCFLYLHCTHDSMRSLHIYLLCLPSVCLRPFPLHLTVSITRVALFIVFCLFGRLVCWLLFYP